MPIASRTLTQVRREILANLGDLLLITAAAGTTTTSLVATAPLPGGDGEYLLSEVYAPSISSNTTWVTACTFSGQIPTFTLSPALTGLASGNQVELHRKFFKDRLDRVIQQAHDELIGWAMVEATDTSLTGDADTSEYAVPSTWVGIHTVEAKKADGHYYGLLPDDWEIVRTGSVATSKLKIALDRLDSIDGLALRLRGYKNPTYPSEATNFEVSPSYIVASATAKLMAGPLDNPSTDPEGKLPNLQYWTAVKELERKRARTPIAPNTKWFL